MDKSAKGGLKSIGNTMTVRKNPPENKEHLQKPYSALGGGTLPALTLTNYDF